MEFNINRTDLFRTLSYLSTLVTRNNPAMILTHVKMTAADGNLTIVGTDMDAVIKTKVPATIKNEGTGAMPLHMLLDILRKLPSDSDVRITCHATDSASVKSGKSNFKLKSLDVTEFPYAEQDDMPIKFSIGQSSLKEMLLLVKHCISKEETRYYLNGVYLHQSENGKLIAAATDGHRLGKCEIALPLGAQMPANGVIIPTKCVEEVLKLIDIATENVQIEISDSKIRFSFGDVILTSKLVDGKFPDYSRVIPKNNSKVLIVDKSEFQSAVDRVSTISLDRIRAVKLELSNNNILLSVNSAEHGNAEDSIAASYSDENITVSFNFKYLLEANKNIKSNSVKLLLNDNTTPAMLQDENDDSYLYVVMPLRV